MIAKVFTTTGILLCALVLFARFDEGEGRRSNGLIKKCGNEAKGFLQWFCADDTFEFPFPFHRIYLVLRYGAPYKQLYPFQHQASICCRYGCQERGYQRMCRYHRMYKKCQKKKNYRVVAGRRKRRLLALCR